MVCRKCAPARGPNLRTGPPNPRTRAEKRTRWHRKPSHSPAAEPSRPPAPRTQRGQESAACLRRDLEGARDQLVARGGDVQAERAGRQRRGGAPVDGVVALVV